jgi:hypothetical protein
LRWCSTTPARWRRNGKLTELKKAAHNLLDTLQGSAKQPGDVKVAIIPFDTTVNVGTGYAGQFWIDYSVKGIHRTNGRAV